MFKVKYRYIFILLLGLYSYVNIIFTEGNRLFDFQLDNLVFFLAIELMVFLIWEGNRILFSKEVGFRVAKIHPLITFFFISLLYILTLTLIFTALFTYTQTSLQDALTFKLILGFTFRVNLFLHCVNAIVYFLNQYKNAQLEAEALKKQNAEARFEALRNQINPHFLFNSFNVLSTLVYKDADTASKFIDQLSNVYRYLLFNQENKLVKLSEELSFIQSYVYLLKIRFQENLMIDTKIDDRLNSTYIAPATLQLLIENAIKHNVVSRNNPLTIKLESNGRYLIVENNIQLKEVKEESSNLGLNNIKKRYDYLCGEDALIINANGVFKVKIPIIEMDP